MAIAEDASTPAVVTATGNSTGTITTASFTPPSNSLLVVVLNVGYTSAGSGIASVTISDTASGSYTAGPFLGDSAADNSGIWFRYLSSSPGSITVTATNSNHPAAGYQLAVRVLTGANSSQSGAASATHTGASATTAVTSAITTTTTGSWVYVAACGNSGDTFTAAAATTLISNLTDATDAEVLGAGRATSRDRHARARRRWGSPPGAVKFSWVALEILPTSTPGTPGPAVYPLKSPVRARLPQLRPRAAGGRVRWNKGAPVSNPPPVPTVVNQWANSYGQGTTFTSITSALQSCVVPLTAGYSVGGGSGTPTEGNWLFCIASWTQDPAIAEVRVGTGDDIHSYWRQYPASSVSGNVRTAIAYTANTASAAGRVYVAPDGQVAAINVLVVEVSGLGEWDTVVSPRQQLRRSRDIAVPHLGRSGCCGVLDRRGRRGLHRPHADIRARRVHDAAFPVADQRVRPSRRQPPHQRLPRLVLLIAVHLRVHLGRLRGPVRVPHRRLGQRHRPDPRRAEPRLAADLLRGRVRRRVQHPRLRDHLDRPVRPAVELGRNHGRPVPARRDPGHPAPRPDRQLRRRPHPVRVPLVVHHLGDPRDGRLLHRHHRAIR